MTSDLQDSKDILKRMRGDILEASTVSQEGHVPSAFSVLEMIYSIYFGNWNIENQVEFDFVLSKGHASLALYAVLEEAKFINGDWKANFAKFDSDYGGHPDSNKIPGVSASTGSLGHGLPFALGKAMANRVTKNEKKVFCLVGDGEMNEGTIWESLLLASHHNVHELVVLADLNHSSDRALALGDVKAKFEAFGYQCIEVDGNDLRQIDEALEMSKSNTLTAILGNTIKGFGLKAMENNPAWHHLSPKSDQLNELKVDLI